ncbi:MAG TPA: hypothetical protein VES42_14615 [Pilimelia sp.]|nr:hypothetical protein [Pilimelia sp.]
MGCTDVGPTLRAAVVDALRHSVRHHLPPGPLRRYFRWGLDPAQPAHPDFLRATGVTQLVNLYAGLADGLVEDAVAEKVSARLARIAVYQTYEIISDNLEFGLFHPAPETDRGAPARRQLVRSFNAAMDVRLRGAGRKAEVLLGPERRRAARLSVFDQSLTGRAHRALAASVPGGPPAEAVERDLWPALVANIEACADTAAGLDGTVLAPLLRDGLLERYRAVTRTLSRRHLSRVELAAVGAHSALVVPTLTYCVAVLVDDHRPLPGAVLADGTLAEAFYDAALLARLLNDAGPAVLAMTRDERRAALATAGDARSIPAALGAALAGPAVTRLAKDLRHGEFNVCLYAARRAVGPAEAVAALEADLHYFARLYELHAERLAEGLAALTDRLGDPRPAAVVKRFVAFQAALYANAYTAPAGEYAA